jgi:hypothetical protein
MSKNTNLTGQPVICQLLSFLPRQIVVFCVSEQQSDRYYKTMTTWKQLVFMLYGDVAKCHSLNSLCKNLIFLEDRLTYLGIDKFPAVSTLSDANINRDNRVFELVYQQLPDHYLEDKEILKQLEKSILLMKFNQDYLKLFLSQGTLTKKDLRDFYSGKDEFRLIEKEINGL